MLEAAHPQGDERCSFVDQRSGERAIGDLTMLSAAELCDAMARAQEATYDSALDPTYGIDLHQPEFWQAGLRIIDEQVEQYLAL